MTSINYKNNNHSSPPQATGFSENTTCLYKNYPDYIDMQKNAHIISKYQPQVFRDNIHKVDTQLLSDTIATYHIDLIKENPDIFNWEVGSTSILNQEDSIISQFAGKINWDAEIEGLTFKNPEKIIRFAEYINIKKHAELISENCPHICKDLGLKIPDYTITGIPQLTDEQLAELTIKQLIELNPDAIKRNPDIIQTPRDLQLVTTYAPEIINMYPYLIENDHKVSLMNATQIEETRIPFNSKYNSTFKNGNLFTDNDIPF